ncbi:MAG: alpha/beta fold hydrolase [Planctomycetaceae bacterium]|nr:MAG: alpha/beta fold hydrolase [Planctomycetaceae bacterium]
MSLEIATFTASDKYRFHLRRRQVADPVAHVLLLHGIISHSGWYPRTASYLADQGFTVHSLDRRGSGLNFEQRGDVAHRNRWVDDVTEYVDSLPADAPVIVAGISWGGLLASAVARRMPSRLCGLALICPGLHSRRGTGAAQQRAVRIAAGLGLGNLKFPVPLREPAWFTNSPAAQRYIRDDPFTLRKVTLRLAAASAEFYREVTHHPEPIETPTLLMLAADDAIIDNARVREFVERHHVGPQQVISYAGAAHTLEFEPNPAEHLSDLARWCRALIGPAS